MPTPGQDDARSTKFVLFAGTARLEPVTISGIQDEYVAVERPDRTRRVSDQRVPFDFTMTFKVRDRVALAFLRTWRSTREHIDCTLILQTEDREEVGTLQLLKVCPRMWSITDLSVSEDATEVTKELTFTCDGVNELT